MKTGQDVKIAANIGTQEKYIAGIRESVWLIGLG